jgi:hypothetical protein
MLKIIKLWLARAKLREAERLVNRAAEFLRRANKLRYDANRLQGKEVQHLGVDEEWVRFREKHAKRIDNEHA